MYLKRKGEAKKEPGLTSQDTTIKEQFAVLETAKKKNEKESAAIREDRERLRLGEIEIKQRLESIAIKEKEIEVKDLELVKKNEDYKKSLNNIFLERKAFDYKLQLLKKESEKLDGQRLSLSESLGKQRNKESRLNDIESQLEIKEKDLSLKLECFEMQKKEVEAKERTFNNLLEELAIKQKDLNDRQKDIKDKEISIAAQEREIRIREGLADEKERIYILRCKGIKI